GHRLRQPGRRPVRVPGRRRGVGEIDREHGAAGGGAHRLQPAAHAVPAAVRRPVVRRGRVPPGHRVAGDGGRPHGGPAAPRHRRGAGPALRPHREGPHGGREAGRPPLVHRRGAALLPQGPAGEIRPEPAALLAGPGGGGEGDPGPRARRRQPPDGGLRVPGEGVRGADLQRAGVDRRLQRRHGGGGRRDGHRRQPAGGGGDRLRGVAGGQRRAHGGAQLRRGGVPRRVPVRQRGVHAQLALRVGEGAGRGQPDQGQGGRDVAPAGRAGRQEHRHAGRLEPGRVAVLDEAGGGDLAGEVPHRPGGAEAARHRLRRQPHHPLAVPGPGRAEGQPLHGEAGGDVPQRGGAAVEEDGADVQPRERGAPDRGARGAGRFGEGRPHAARAGREAGEDAPRREVVMDARRRARSAWLFLAPSLAVLALVAGWPLLRTFWFSLTDADLGGMEETRFVGLENYRELFSDWLWWLSVWTTFRFAIISVLLETALGLGIAMVLHARFAGRGVLRAAVLIPWAIPTVVSARMWGWMFNDVYGVVNEILLKLGIIQDALAWTADPRLALPAVIAVDVWKTTPFMTLLILAALQTLPDDVYEAAQIDGARPLRVFFRITLPLIRGPLMVAVIFRM